ncbi:MAG TPA: FAD-dependent oxidoreductase [Stellaceae bacterium]|nr:FAD-dependent oxidoreductase [Stellaceae bacterium]
MTTDAPLLAPDFRGDPYWWDAAPRPFIQPLPLPPRIDVAIVGSGITGLSAALRLARAGRSVAVFDAGDPGIGASSRNAGFVGRTLKHEFGDILDRFGLERARAVYGEMQAAFDAVTETVAAERIDCHLAICGRVMAARTPRQYEALARELELRRRHLGNDFAMLRGEELRREIGSDSFVGGALLPDLGSLHPGLYHLGLLDRAREAGVAIHGRTAVVALATRRRGEIGVHTERGIVIARDALVATNGYTGRAMPWLRRRVIPFNAFMIATAPLPQALLDRLLPRQRTYIDCNFNVDAIRRSPDGTRILYCGRTGLNVSEPHAIARRLKAALVAIFPELADVPLSHAWTGRCAGTFDLYPHIGEQAGLHYAMGYCFAGVPMGTYLGRKAAAKILGAADGATIFDALPFPSHFLYSGNPWFVPLAMRFYDWKDRRAA